MTTDTTSTYFSVVAQVLPTLLIVVGLDLALLRWLAARLFAANVRFRYGSFPETLWARWYYIDSEADLGRRLMHRKGRSGWVSRSLVAAPVALVVAAELVAVASLAWPPVGVWKAIGVVVTLTATGFLMLAIALGLVRTSQAFTFVDLHLADDPYRDLDRG